MATVVNRVFAAKHTNGGQAFLASDYVLVDGAHEQELVDFLKVVRWSFLISCSAISQLHHPHASWRLHDLISSHSLPAVLWRVQPRTTILPPVDPWLHCSGRRVQ